MFKCQYVNKYIISKEQTRYILTKILSFEQVDVTTLENDNTEYTTLNADQGNLLRGIVNWLGAAQSVVQGPKQPL